MACLILKKKGRSSMATEIVGPSLWESTEQQVGHEKARSKLCTEIKVGTRKVCNHCMQKIEVRIKKKARDQWMCKSSKFKATGNFLTQSSSCIVSKSFPLWSSLLLAIFLQMIAWIETYSSPFTAYLMALDYQL
jgi:cytochrome c551/c552